MMQKLQTRSLNRRKFLINTGLVAGSLSVLGSRTALAQGSQRIVIGTWGGDYGRFLQEFVEQPFLETQGFEIVQDQGSSSDRNAKMLAERRLPTGTTDIQALDDSFMYGAFSQGLLEEIDYEQISNAANILPNLRLSYGVPQIFSGKVVLYNPDLMDMPQSYADVFTPDMGDNLGVIDIQYRHVIAVASLVAGGSVTAVEDGQRLLLELRQAGARVYPTNEAFAQALETQEISGGIMWKARSLQWQSAGINVLSVTPSEGFIPFVSGFVIPRNAPNKEGAYAYMNALLEPEAQLRFAENMGYAGSVSNAPIPDDLQESIGFSPEQVEAMQPLDFEFFVENDVELKSWWDQVFLG